MAPRRKSGNKTTAQAQGRQRESTTLMKLPDEVLARVVEQLAVHEDGPWLCRSQFLLNDAVSVYSYLFVCRRLTAIVSRVLNRHVFPTTPERLARWSINLHMGSRAQQVETLVLPVAEDDMDVDFIVGVLGAVLPQLSNLRSLESPVWPDYRHKCLADALAYCTRLRMLGWRDRRDVEETTHLPLDHINHALDAHAVRLRELRLGSTVLSGQLTSSDLLLPSLVALDVEAWATSSHTAMVALLRRLTSSAPRLKVLFIDGRDQTWLPDDFSSIIEPTSGSLRALGILGASVPRRDDTSVLDDFLRLAKDLRALAIPSAEDIGAKCFETHARALSVFGLQSLDVANSAHMLRIAGLLTSEHIKEFAFPADMTPEDERITLLNVRHTIILPRVVSPHRQFLCKSSDVDTWNFFDFRSFRSFAGL